MSAPALGAPSVSVVLPSFNESGNVAALVSRLDAVFARLGTRAEVLYVDDSTDDTADRVRAAARGARSLDLSVLERTEPAGGLSGAVVTGLLATGGDVVVVMDADLQHPPETLPALLEALGRGADVAVASRRVEGGSSAGLDGWWRQAASLGCSAVARALFPRRLRRCSDPMTGFFALRRSSVQLGRLRADGFKILLELLARHRLHVVEVPLVFADRLTGESKASSEVGRAYLRQVLRLRLQGWSGSRVVRFGAVGAVGAMANLAIMAGLMAAGSGYVVASLVAAEVTIIGNFLVQERLVFADLAGGGRSWNRARWSRAAGWLAFNNTELLVRTPALVLVVEVGRLPELAAQALLLVAAFAVRFGFARGVLYRKRWSLRPSAPAAVQGAAAAAVILPETDLVTGSSAWPEEGQERLVPSA